MNNLDDDLFKILDDIKPNILSPHLGEIIPLSNEKKPRMITDILIRQMYQSISNPIQKDIMHNGEIHRIRYFSIEPLLSGVWGMISLLILNLSYGEQSVIIEALYPEKVQLSAKAFALTFSSNSSNNQPTINIKDTEMIDKIDATNAGIATIIAILSGKGFQQPHPDAVKRSLSDMNDLVETTREIEEYAKATKRAKQASTYQDKL